MWHDPPIRADSLAASVAAMLEACAPRIAIGRGRVISQFFAPDRSLLALVRDDADGSCPVILDEALVLCRGQRADRCVLATEYLTAFETRKAATVAHADIEAIVIAPTAIKEVMAGSRTIRGLVFRAYCQRMAELCATHDTPPSLTAPTRRDTDLAALLRDAQPFGRPV